MTSQPSHNSTTATPGSTIASAAEAERFARLWEESRQVRGVSLGRDAWRRLRRNRAATASLTFLVILGIAALLTPFWPLLVATT